MKSSHEGLEIAKDYLRGKGVPEKDLAKLKPNRSTDFLLLEFSKGVPWAEAKASLEKVLMEGRLDEVLPPRGKPKPIEWPAFLACPSCPEQIIAFDQCSPGAAHGHGDCPECNAQLTIYPGRL